MVVVPTAAAAAPEEGDGGVPSSSFSNVVAAAPSVGVGGLTDMSGDETAADESPRREASPPLCGIDVAAGASPLPLSKRSRRIPPSVCFAAPHSAATSWSSSEEESHGSQRAKVRSVMASMPNSFPGCAILSELCCLTNDIDVDTMCFFVCALFCVSDDKLSVGESHFSAHEGMTLDCHVCCCVRTLARWNGVPPFPRHLSPTLTHTKTRNGELAGSGGEEGDAEERVEKHEATPISIVIATILERKKQHPFAPPFASVRCVYIHTVRSSSAMQVTDFWWPL